MFFFEAYLRILLTLFWAGVPLEVVFTPFNYIYKLTGVS